ncbi:MAG TPA: Hsp70 family protein, partial [Micromonosporaceae bacterium]
MALPTSSAPTGFRLGVDFGTSHTAAILRWPDGHARPLLFDGSPLLPSAVYADNDDQLLVGRDAVHAARLDPARFEPSPKRRLDQPPVQLGDRQVEPAAMVAAVLARVREEAVRVSGATDLTVRLTHPAGWSQAQRQVLVEAGGRAGLPVPDLVAEPVAAAAYFVTVLARTIPAGGALVVYDFGGGTFDASAVAPTDDGYQVLAMAGLPDLGGVDLDTALLDHVAARYREQDPAAWERLEQPQTAADRRHRRHLIEDVRAAKEMLSRADAATVPIPLLELEARVTRAEFEQLSLALLERTVACTQTVIEQIGATRVAAVLLVGGSSRIPLVARLIQDRLGLTPATIDQPETVVAEGSIRLAEGGTGTTRASSAVPTPAAAQRAPADHLAPPVDPWAGATSPGLVADPDATPLVPTPALAAPAGLGTQPAPAAPGSPPVAATRTLPQLPDQRPDRLAAPVRGTAYRDRHQGGTGTRRLWLAALAVVAIAGLTTAAVLVVPRLLPLTSAPPTNGPTGTPTTHGSPSPRTDPPAWLPAGWEKIADDGVDGGVVDLGRAPANGGTCEYLSAGVLRVR